MHRAVVLTDVASQVMRIAQLRGFRVAVAWVARAAVSRRRGLGRRYYFLSHRLDYTGAPLVLVDVISDFLARVDPRDVVLVHPGAENALVRPLTDRKVCEEGMVEGLHGRLVDAQLRMAPDDFVLMNSAAVSAPYRNHVLSSLERGKLHHAFWYIHEAELHWFGGELLERVGALVRPGRLTVVVPSIAVARQYNTLWATSRVQTCVPRVSVPAQHLVSREAEDFGSLRFVLTGTISRGLKGQMLAIVGLSHALAEAERVGRRLRACELHLVGADEDSYWSKQLRLVADALIPGIAVFYPKLPKAQVLDIAARCNTTVCVSHSECFPLSVAEGMLMGHVLLRNGVPGVDEQLRDGENGYLVVSEDIPAVAQAFLKVLDTATSNEVLQNMSGRSQEIGQGFTTVDYFDWLAASQAVLS